MKQRIGIAMALLGNPVLLILDEPINGLDVDGMKLMREILVDITQKLNVTVLISSHILGELEKIATHYGIIRQGSMLMFMMVPIISPLDSTIINVIFSFVGGLLFSIGLGVVSNKILNKTRLV